MPVRPDGWVSIPVGISLVPFELDVGTIMIEEWVALITIGVTFMLDLSPENLLLPALFEGPLRQGRELVTIFACEGKATSVAL